MSETTTDTPKITKNEGVLDLAAIRSALLTEENCSSTNFDTSFPSVRDSDSSVSSGKTFWSWSRGNVQDFRRAAFE